MYNFWLYESLGGQWAHARQRKGREDRFGHSSSLIRNHNPALRSAQDSTQFTPRDNSHRTLFYYYSSIYALVFQVLSTRVICGLKFWTNSATPHYRYASPLFYPLCFDQHNNKLVCEGYNSGNSWYSSLDPPATALVQTQTFSSEIHSFCGSLLYEDVSV